MRSRSGAELPQLELECLRALWELDRARVGEVRQRLAETGRGLAYTTVLTVLDRLLRKQAVARERRGRAFVYRAAIARDTMREHALARLVENYFRSRDELRQYLREADSPPPAGQPQNEDAGEGLDAALL